jgi:hypothetical protein
MWATRVGIQTHMKRKGGATYVGHQVWLAGKRKPPE